MSEKIKLRVVVVAIHEVEINRSTYEGIFDINDDEEIIKFEKEQVAEMPAEVLEDAEYINIDIRVIE